MRSVSTAKRLRFLSWLVLLYGLATIVAGAVVGVQFYRYVRDIPFKIVDDQYVAPTTSRPYEWLGIGIAIAALVVGTFVIVIAELIRLKANLVIEERTAAAAASHRAVANGAPSSPAHSPVAPVAARPRPRRGGRDRTGDRVVVLTAAQAEQLAAVPPPASAEGWYPDPLGDADLRRWNGAQWTGEQRTIALPKV